MSITKEKLNRVVEAVSDGTIFKRIENFDREAADKAESIPFDNPYTKEGQDDRLALIAKLTGQQMAYLSGKKSFTDNALIKGNIENYVGMSMVPTGVMGPLVINGTHASGAFYIPLATSEGALVASYARGAKACKVSGAIRAVCLMEGVQRCPVFKFENLLDLGKFVVWMMAQREEFVRITSKVSRHAKLNDMEFNIEGNIINLTLEYTTGDASGQNMVTICTKAICDFIIENTPVKPVIWFLEGNMSGDKKATMGSFQSVRGKNVTAEITLSREAVVDVLKTTPELMFEYWKTSSMGAVKSGAIGAQGHFSNGLAALFIACGQDAACVSEASVGMTRFEPSADGGLYASVTLPNLIVGTVGGGTSLPTQRECLELMDCYGEGRAKKFAEICTSVCLSGELSIVAALSAHHFASAHAKLGRK